MPDFLRNVDPYFGFDDEDENIPSFDALSDSEKDELSDEEFDEIMENDVLSFDDLSEEEIMRRQAEFANLSDEGREMLNEIKGIQNSRVITLELLMYNSVAIIRDSADDIEDIEFSESYLEFMNWYNEKVNTNEINLPEYYEKVIIFENILNSGLENEDENNIFSYFKKKYIEKIRGKVNEIDEPMSSLEIEAARRFDDLSTTDKNLIEIFENIKEYKDMKWDEFQDKVLDV